MAAGKQEVRIFRHRVEFLRRGDPAPRVVRRFVEGITPVEPGAVENATLLLCTSAEWAVVEAAGAERGFCGAFDLDGKELFRLPDEADGTTREPVGMARDRREALFALTRPRKNGDREVVGYRLWTRGQPSEFVPADGPRARALLEKYEGRLVLPSPGRGN